MVGICSVDYLSNSVANILGVVIFFNYLMDFGISKSVADPITANQNSIIFQFFKEIGCSLRGYLFLVPDSPCYHIFLVVCAFGVCF